MLGFKPKPTDSHNPAPTGSHAEASRQTGAFAALRDKVQRRLLVTLSPTVDTTNTQEVRRAVEHIFAETLAEEQIPLSRAERTGLLEQIMADILGYGPLDPLLRDDSVTEVLVNGPNLIFVEREGILEETGVHFQDTASVMRVIDRILAPLGRRVDESSPMVDARLPDGSRVNIIIPPLALDGPSISIRKFAKAIFSPDDLFQAGTITEGMLEFMRACVLARMNIVISGGTSTGKTTLLNVLSSFLPGNERIVTIEDAAELRLHQRHIVRLEARPANVEGKGEVTIRQLVINALRMRPDRIVVGEVRGGEALDMLQAMNTGHDGSLTTAHSNSPRDTLHRVATMALMAGMDLPLRAVLEQIASAFDLIVHLDRLADGSRRVMTITEVQGMEGDVIVLQDLFNYHQTGIKEGRVQGYFSPTGIRPGFMSHLRAAGYDLPTDIFTPVQPKSKR